MARALTHFNGAFEPPAPGNQRRGWTLGIAVLLGLTGGVIGAVGRPEVTAVVLGLVLAALLVSSRTALFWFVVIGALVVTGVAQLYLPGSRSLRYVVPIASLGLVVHWFIDAHAARRAEAVLVPPPMVWALTFALVGVASALVNLSDPLVTLVGFKNYFQMAVFLLAVAFMRWDDRWLHRVYAALILVALLQLPFAVHQYVALMPQRIGLGEGIVPADVVAGTFGAMLLGGGANAVLAAFQVIVVGLVLAMWKNGRMSALPTVFLTVLLLSPLLVNQAKVAVLYVPLMFLVVFHRDILRRPGKFLFAGASLAGIVAVLLTALLWTNPSGRLNSWSELVDSVIARQTATVEERSGQYAELSRWTALTFWAQQHVHANPVQTLLGHGPGASREPEGSLELSGATLAQRKYAGLRIGHTAVSALLWDVGLVGLGVVLGMFASAFVVAGRLARHFRGRDEFRAGLFEGLQAAVAVLTLSLAHKDFFVVHIPFQALVCLVIGIIANQWLQLRHKTVSPHA